MSAVLKRPNDPAPGELTAIEVLERIQCASAEYTRLRKVTMDLGLQVAELDGPVPDDLRHALSAACVNQTNASRALAAHTMVLCGSGMIRQCIAALEVLR